MRKKLPVGIEEFKIFSAQDFYYVDKTMFIAELLENWGKVNLFTRPRRFGKSLTMSMLKAFLEIGCDQTLFDGLRISREKSLCEKHMGRYPVISITLKSVDAPDYEAAKLQLKKVIGTEAERFECLKTDGKLSDNDREKYSALIRMRDGSYTMQDVVLINSLQTLSALLTKYYGQEAIILIDEYDVPLEKAFQAGYYEEMRSLLRGLLGNALKTNEFLHFAVLTGCMRISRESIFTGLNNFKIHSITDQRYEEYFGFTEPDVRDLLAYYGLSDKMTSVKEWYNGYLFGNVSVYCPWDVINYCDKLLANPDLEPEDYWANTSENALMRRFIERADQRTRDEIERLIAGGSIVKEIRQELTYKELDDSVEHLWSVLFTTGYLTAEERLSAKTYRLRIPNMEIRDLFISQVKEWFRKKAEAEPGILDTFCGAILAGDAATVQKMLTDYLKQTISIRDTGVRKVRKENFYHGILLGLLRHREDWGIRSGEESGEGYGDILIRDFSADTGIVIETKYAENSSFEKACAEALHQIERKNYAEALYDDGMENVLKYGIAFYKKRCRVVCSADISG